MVNKEILKEIDTLIKNQAHISKSLQETPDNEILLFALDRTHAKITAKLKKLR